MYLCFHNFTSVSDYDVCFQASFVFGFVTRKTWDPRHTHDLHGCKALPGTCTLWSSSCRGSSSSLFRPARSRLPNTHLKKKDRNELLVRQIVCFFVGYVAFGRFNVIR